MLGALSSGLASAAGVQPEEAIKSGRATGSAFTNRKFNQAEDSYQRNTSALDKQLEQERGGFPIAEAAGKLPQEDFTNKMAVAKEQREQTTAAGNEQYKSDLNDIRQTMNAGKLDEAQKKLDEQSQKNTNDFQYHRDLLELRSQLLDAREKAAGNKPNVNVGIENRKAQALAKAKRQYDKDTQAAGNDPDARKAADDSFKEAQQDAQDAYENEITAGGGSAAHSDWPSGNKPTPSSPQSSKPESAKGAPKVGDTRMVKGKQMTITKVYRNGTFDAK